MAAFPHDCPHCGAQNASFTVFSEYRHPARGDEIHAFLSCGVCGGSAVAVFSARRGDLGLREYLPSYPDNFHLQDFHPRPAIPEAPAHLPENVRIYYLEAVADVKARPNAAGAMFRKALDVGLKTIEPDGKGNLLVRIDAAAAAGRITKDLAEWAHRIRLEGNDASHDEDPYTADEAHGLHRFTELVMMYLFTLPGMLADWKKKDGEDAGESG